MTDGLMNRPPSSEFLALNIAHAHAGRANFSSMGEGGGPGALPGPAGNSPERGPGRHCCLPSISVGGFAERHFSIKKKKKKKELRGIRLCGAYSWGLPPSPPRAGHVCFASFDEEAVII